MAQRVLSRLIPAGGGRWPIVEDVHFIGGYRTVPDLAARDEIFTNDDMRPGLKPGTLVQVYDTQVVYQWRGLDSNGAPTWSVFARPTMYVHRVAADQATKQWIVTHNMGSIDFTVDVWFGPVKVMPAEVKVVDSNNVVISFGDIASGKAVLNFYYGD